MRNVSKLPVVIGLLLTCAWAGPKFTFNDGKSDCELTQSYQVWAA
jgi:hypothetical protein